MIPRIQEIDNLAEKVANKYNSGYPVNPLQIASKIDIEVVEGSEDYPFKGLILRDNKRFFIILNMIKLLNISYSRCRFTLSHELGHYFIKNHRDKLRKGESIAFTDKNIEDDEKKIIEDEAQQFASSLLMPKSHFIAYYNSIENVGFDAVIRLKTFYNVSITAAAIRVVKLNLEPIVCILWNEDYIKSKSVSESFQKLIGSNEIEMKLNINRPAIDVKTIKDVESGVNYVKSITPLSSWTYNFSKEYSNSFLLIEETLYFQYGNITLLRPAA